MYDCYIVSVTDAKGTRAAAATAERSQAVLVMFFWSWRSRLRRIEYAHMRPGTQRQSKSFEDAAAAVVVKGGHWMQLAKESLPIAVA